MYAVIQGYHCVGSLECSGHAACLVYCVAGDTLKARVARNSRGDIMPNAGINRKPLQPVKYILPHENVVMISC